VGILLVLLTLFVCFAIGLPIAYAPLKTDASIARLINAIFGGGVASASSGPAVGTACTALAFTDATFTTLDGGDDAALGTQGGCFTAAGLSTFGFGSGNADVQASEPGFTGAFSANTGTCNATLSAFPQPDHTGVAKANLGFSIVPSATSGTCTFAIADGSGSAAQQKTVTAQVAAPGCVSGVSCAVLIDTNSLVCTNLGAGLLIQSGSLSRKLFQSSDGGSTWTPIWSGSFTYLNSHGGCPDLSPPTEDFSQAGTPPVSPDWTRTETLNMTANNHSTTSASWQPLNPPSYVTTQFGV